MSPVSSTAADPLPAVAPLRAWLERFGPEDTVWTDGVRRWSAAELRERLAASAAVAARFQDRVVALAVRSAPTLARLLLTFDGHAQALLLIPADTSDEQRTAFLRAAGVQVLVADAPPPVSGGIEGVPALAVLEPGQRPPAPVAGPARETRVILPTSGTTGTPKLVSHSWATLARTVRAAEEESPRRWGLLYEPGRFAGLQVFLQALASAATLIFTDHLPDLEARLALLAAEGCDALSATPTLWRKILMTTAGRQLPLRQVTLGGEIADDLVLAALMRAYPRARITHIYASTEAGVGFSVRDGRAGFPASYLNEPPGGVELKVDAAGRLWLRPPVRGQFLIGGGALEDAEGWVDSGDLVERRGDRFYFLGRASGAINVGGDKVFPEEVERVILELPEIALARVSGRRNPITGALVEAMVAPAGPVADPVALARRVREHCAARLPRHKVPAVVQVVDALEVEGTGKLARRGK